MKNLAWLLAVLFWTSSGHADEKSIYNFSWLDKDKEIYVLQNRKFRKDGNFYAGLTGAKTLSGAFIDSYGGTARAGYFFREDWGVEFVFGKNTGSENDTAKAVRAQSTVPFYRKIDTYTGAMVMWSPFYSKINTFNRVVYFDWIFGLGAANIKTLDNRNKFSPGADEDKLTSDNLFGALWSTGFRFYLNENWSIRLDVTGQTFSAEREVGSIGSPKKTTSVLTTFDLGLGLNYAF
jgi:outer membrane beta-barrel protein